ncbi:hypothetical protein L1987_45069 [Smallanthus sonchifolius]|uniref:Uncharacterized protein n=1 Tax=Smallanthus sonchifolius TaxID=185202 RepID=A0ACB9GS95_9ASTR|nr:hypothetical protein L1987_45069 [Smallanthus sonchifolius]
MASDTQGVVFLLAMVSWAIYAQNSEARVKLENGVKSMVYLSPKITQLPGSVSNKTYYDIEFPKGNAGLCNHGRSQFFGMGSETRKTSTYVPDPYGIEVGDPLKVPAGYEEKWMFNIHAIDTHGAVDAMGCNECRCNLYNVTKDKDGQPLKPNYVGGLYCCYDGTLCKVKNGLRNHTGIHDCLFEYDVEKSTNNYINTRRSSVSFPAAGDVIYGFAQQYIGGIGAALYGELCLDCAVVLVAYRRRKQSKDGYQSIAT